jgi:hypothetical protein
MYKNLCMHKQNLSRLEDNYEDIAHASKKLDKHIEMIQAQCEPVASYQSSIIDKVHSNRTVSSNTATRCGTVVKGPAGPWWQQLYSSKYHSLGL